MNELERGYYWAKIKSNNIVTVAFYEGINYISSYPFQVVGSDKIFKKEEIDVLERVEGQEKYLEKE